jgi:hypothetical protein
MKERLERIEATTMEQDGGRVVRSFVVGASKGRLTPIHGDGDRTHCFACAAVAHSGPISPAAEAAAAARTRERARLPLSVLRRRRRRTRRDPRDPRPPRDPCGLPRAVTRLVLTFSPLKNFIS